MIIQKIKLGGLRLLAITVLALMCWINIAAAADIPVGEATLSLDDGGNISGLSFTDDTYFSTGTRKSAIRLEGLKGQAGPSSVSYADGMLSVSFEEGSFLKFSVDEHDKFTLFRLTELRLSAFVSGIRLFSLPVPRGARVNSTLNAAFWEGKAFAQMSATPETLAFNSHNRGRTADLKGCSHTFTQTSRSRVGRFAAEFVSTCTLAGNGWSMQGVRLDENLAQSDISGLAAWVYGDGKGEQLKFQLIDDGGGARDYYVPIDFTGWRRIEMTTAALDIVRGKKLAGLNLYYNSIPGETTVACLVDDIHAIIDDHGSTRAVALENFEDPESPWWNDGGNVLNMEWDFRHAGVGDGFAIIACPEEEFFSAVQEFEKAAGIITPYPDGQWNKQSRAVEESYLFLTSFKETQFDEAVRLAKRGGFKRVLLGQGSWCQSTGHYGIKRQHFADGLPGLVRTVQRFRDEGIEVGLHLLGASIDNNDPYLTPVPDARLVKDATTKLTKEIDDSTTTIVVAAMPEGFPSEDGGYNGDGMVLQIGTELIKYDALTTAPPYTFSGCVRGHHGTRPASHAKGAVVSHLARSYGYHMFDMDTTLLDEVTSNFAAVANACDIDMVYFDGSERLQGDHSRYNARLINAYLSKLNRNDILVQASSFSHFSWHQLARSASADGHGDLKGYLEQRSPNFNNFKKSGMPLDIGWYYGYDKSATPDMYEYILGTTIGYDASFSYQVSVAAAHAHPFTGEILDLINRYDKLRLSGRVPQEMRELLQVPKELAGRAPEDETRQTELRRDYHLINNNGQDAFQRVIYGDWQTGDAGKSEIQWEVEVTSGPALLGLQVQVLDKPTTGQLAQPGIEIDGQQLRWNETLAAGQYLFFWPDEPVSVYGEPLKEKRITDEITPVIKLPAGKHTVRFSAGPDSTASYRVRVTLQPPERHVMPAE